MGSVCSVPEKERRLGNLGVEGSALTMVIISFIYKLASLMASRFLLVAISDF